jgi:hypothetical protein
MTTRYRVECESRPCGMEAGGGEDEDEDEDEDDNNDECANLVLRCSQSLASSSALLPVSRTRT